MVVYIAGAAACAAIAAALVMRKRVSILLFMW
jgi:hypothetical protein